MTAQEQINAYNSIGSFISQWGENISSVASALTASGLSGAATQYMQIQKDNAAAYLTVKDTAEASTFGKAAQVIADVRYNGTPINDAISQADFNGWDALVAGAELLPLDLIATGAKAATGKTDQLTTDDAITSAIDVIGLVPIAGWAAKSAIVPAKAAAKTIINTGDAVIDATKLTSKTAKIENSISAVSTLSTIGNIGLTAAYFGDGIKQVFDEADQSEPQQNLTIVQPVQSQDGGSNPAWIPEPTGKTETLQQTTTENQFISAAILICGIIASIAIIRTDHRTTK